MHKLETKVVLNKLNQKPAAAVIWLHGLGADYNDFIPIIDELHLAVPVKFVFPNAPVIPVTINGGLKMRAWYDILDFSDLSRKIDSAGILQNVEAINILIEDLIDEGFKSEEIILAGFSQGGVICYYAALASKYKLGGLLILSSYLPDVSLLNINQIQHKIDMPILICHGVSDPVININYAKTAVKQLQGFGLACKYSEFDVAHGVCYEEIIVIAKWLELCVKS